MNAKLTMAGYQLIVFYRLLTIAKASENDPEMRSLMEGPLERMGDSVEHADENLFVDYNIGISEIFWKLVRGNFKTNADPKELRGFIETAMAGAFAAEIERQFAELAKQPPAST